MRLTEHRHARDLRRYALALRMLRHETRRQTVVQWTGLSVDRITKLANDDSGTRPRGFVPLRGHSPYQVAFFFGEDEVLCGSERIAGLRPPSHCNCCVRAFATTAALDGS